MEKGLIDWIALILVIVGGLNWGLAVFDFNLVTKIFGTGLMMDIIYSLVGISALYMIYFMLKK